LMEIDSLNEDVMYVLKEILSIEEGIKKQKTGEAWLRLSTDRINKHEKLCQCINSDYASNF
jgi:hypothetical protein